SGSLRYGENPHQSAAFYRLPGHEGFAGMVQHQGKSLSYNNLADADTAWALAQSFRVPAAAAIKHQNPCGVGLALTPEDAFQKAYESDPVSIFGGIVAFNVPVNARTAEKLVKIFLEVVLAPGYTEEALRILAQKKNVRVLTMPEKAASRLQDIRMVAGGFLVQDRDKEIRTWDQFEQVAGPAVDLSQWQEDIAVAWTTVRFTKSNAIVLAQDGMTVGIGGGQTNRIDAAKQAIERAGKRASGAVLASDAFFPFGDVMEEAAAHGIGLVIEPGGSIRDDESIAVAQAQNVPLIFTHERHFRH
ncbi:MAG: bifunctional phosphoribosylaminoimidazolecarboxamide formyltransferase/IMP cyclohydrolase PurH, partial [Firmicutes bacterium]|nr:bifunctional phosphoribosylaminoimidazolecarboxamide formyltransferase/IMP cyclohydrolase PurH [Bacillota bacterium]